MSIMRSSAEQMFSLAESFHSAAVGSMSWESALRGLARATGARSIQLTGTDPQDSVLFKIRTDADLISTHLPGSSVTCSAPANSADPARVLKVAFPCDVPWLCMSTSERRRKLLLSLAAVRSHDDAHITSEQREIFSMTALHVRSALCTHIALQHDRMRQLTEVLETLSVAVFICDSTGRVRTLTRAAEALLTTGRGLGMIDGQMCALRSDDAEALRDAISAVTHCEVSAGSRPLRTVVVRGNAVPIVVDVFALPSQHSLELLGSTPGVLLVARGVTGGDRRKASVLQVMYGLTDAETEIALRLAGGRTARVIAGERSVAVGTVRAQIKTVMAKMGVRRQVELAARLSQL
jgi:DNA-binding CsgD family transcriptional regulator